MLCHIFLNQVYGMLKDENLVAHDHSHQSDKSHHRGKPQRAVHQSETYKGTRQHQPKRSYADGGDAKLLKVEQQEEKDDDHSDGHPAEDLRQCLSIVFYLASHFGPHSLWQPQFLLHDLSHTFLNGSCIDSLSKLTCHSQTALAPTVHDAALHPLRLDAGHLSQSHAGITSAYIARQHGQGCSDRKVGNIRERQRAGIPEHDGQGIVALPQLSYAYITRSCRQRKGCRGAAHAQL